MNRRFFLGRAGLAVAAAPALVKQAEETVLSHRLPQIDTSDAAEAPDARWSHAMPTAARKADPILKLLRAKARDEERAQGRRDRIRARALWGMRSWSPVFAEMQAMEIEQREKGALEAIYEEIRKLGKDDE